MNQNKNIEQISGCFQNLRSEDVAYLNKKKTQLTYFKGETIFKQGAFAPHVLFVNKGLVLVYLQIGKEKKINIHLARQGDYLAFSTVFNKNVYQYSAISITDSTLCMIEKDALKNVIINNSDFAMQITSRNSQNESRYLDIIKNVSYKQMRGKLASALLYLSNDKFNDDPVFQYLTRQDIADFASITVESTVKFLKEFEKENLIDLNGKEITIKDKQLLTEIDLKG